MKIRHILILSVLCLAVGFLLQGCSTTSHLPEGEVLYTGISDISFGQKSKKAPEKQQKTATFFLEP